MTKPNTKSSRVGITVRFNRDEITVLNGIAQLIGAKDLKGCVKTLTLEMAKIVINHEKKKREEAQKVQAEKIKQDNEKIRQEAANQEVNNAEEKIQSKPEIDTEIAPSSSDS